MTPPNEHDHEQIPGLDERTQPMTVQRSDDQDALAFLHNAPPTDYTAEPPVQLRSQGLRRRTPDPVPEEEPMTDPIDVEAAAPDRRAPVTEEPVQTEPAPPALAYSQAPNPEPAAPQPEPEAVSENPYGIPAQPHHDEPQGAGFMQQPHGRVLVDPDPGARRLDGIGQARPGLLETNAGVEDDPAEWGWRGRLNASFGMHLRPHPESEEVAHRRNIERIRQPLSGFWKVGVLNVKGGMGKTPTTIMLGNSFGQYRGGGVVMWDSNESKGTLSERASTSVAPNGGQPSVWDVLEHASELAGPNAQAGALAHFLRKQPTMDEVLASDQSSKRMKAIGAEECAAIEAVLRRHRSGVIIDTGNDDTSPNWQWVTENVHQVVIPMPYRRDAAAKVVQMLDGMHARDLSTLVSSAIVALAPAPGAGDADREDIIEELRGQGVHRFMDMPYEAAFEGAGARIVYNRLPRATRVAYAELAAEIADSLAKSRSRAVEFDAGLVPASITRPAEYDVRGSRRAPGYPTRGYPAGPAAYGPPGGAWQTQEPFYPGAHQ